MSAPAADSRPTGEPSHLAEHVPVPTVSPSLLESGLCHYPREGAPAGGQRAGAPVHGECVPLPPPSPQLLQTGLESKAYP